MYIHVNKEIFVVTAKVFQSGNSQAIRIPSDFHTEQKEFYIRRLGQGFYLIPVSDPWYLVRSGINVTAAEPEITRDQPQLLELPSREDF